MPRAVGSRLLLPRSRSNATWVPSVQKSEVRDVHVVAELVRIRRPGRGTVERVHAPQQDIDEVLSIARVDPLGEEDVEVRRQEWVLEARQEVRIVRRTRGIEQVLLTNADHDLIDQRI